MRGLENLHNRWLAVQVRAGWEMRTAGGLRQGGYEELVPCYQQKIQRSDRIRMVQTPLFPGYVFLRFRLDNQQPVVFIPGVIRFVGMANTPIPIDDSEIEALQIAGRVPCKCGPWPFLQIGQEVEVRNGPFSGLKGKIVRFKNQQRLIITLNLLQKSAFVEIEESEVNTSKSGPAIPG